LQVLAVELEQIEPHRNACRSCSRLCRRSKSATPKPSQTTASPSIVTSQASAAAAFAISGYPIRPVIAAAGEQAPTRSPRRQTMNR
jgi:hypothetical protein